jgi:hypothetical protein
MCFRALLCLPFVLATSAFSNTERQGAAVTTRLEKLPTDFIENRGQWSSAVKFAVRKNNWAASFQDRAVEVRAGRDKKKSVRLVFEGALGEAVLTGEGRRTGHYNSCPPLSRHSGSRVRLF